MADFAIVQAACRTTTGLQSFTSTGFGTPVGAIFLVTTGTANGTVAAHAILGVGATDGTRTIAMDGRSRDAVATALTAHRGYTTHCLSMRKEDGTGDYLFADFNAWVTDGVQVNIVTAPASAYLITCILLGGTGVSNFYCNTVATPATINTATTVNTVGFLADAMLVFGEGGDPWNGSSNARNALSIGIVQRTGSDPPPQFSTNFHDRTGVNPTELNGMLNTTLANQITSVAGDVAMEVRNFTSSGFDAYQRTSAGPATWGYICMKFSGLSVKAMALDSPVAGGSQAFTGIGLTPTFGLLLMDALTVNDTRSTDTTGEVLAIGVMTATAQGCVAINSNDNVSPSVCKSVTHTRPIYLNKTGAVFEDATFTSFAFDTATLNYGTADGTVRKWAGLFLGPSGISPSVNDSTAVTDFVAVKMSKVLLTVFDSVAISEADFLQSAVIFSPPVVSDSTQVTDACTVLLTTLNITVNDSTAVTESLPAITYTQTTLAITVGDDVPMFDLVGGIATFQYFNVSVGDAVGVNRGYAQIDWDANTEPDLAGYRVYQGTTSGVYGPVELPYNGGTADYYDVGNVTSYTVLNLDFGTTYYFVVTAYDTSNNESAPSAEVSKTPTDVLLGNVQIDAGAYAVNDDTAITDDVTMNLLLLPQSMDAGSDLVIVTENHTLLFPFIAMDPGDLVTVTDGLPTVTLVTEAQIFIAVGDGVPVTDFVNAQFAGIVNVNDTTAITENVKLMLLVSLRAMAAGQDTTGITDSVTMLMGLAIVPGTLTVFDSTAITESVTVRMSKVLLNVFDNQIVSDGFAGLPPQLVGPGGNTNQGRLTNIAGTSPGTVIT